MKAADLGVARIVAQRLVGESFGDPAQAVAWLGCVQAQDLPGALVSVALRTRDRKVADVVAAIDDARIVRSWPMRGTLHFAPAKDIGWMCGLTAPRMFAQAAQRRQQLGINEAMIAKAGDVAEAAIAEAGPLTRSEILTLWEPEGFVEVKGRGYHLLSVLCYQGRLIMGPIRAKEQCFASLSTWVPDRVTPERDDALGRWAAMYFRSHGPATAQDFARWTGLTMGDVKTAIAVAGGDLTTVEIDNQLYLMDPELPDLVRKHRRKAREVMLLPGFDELILGYKDRSCTVDAAHEALIVPGKNGVFKPTIVSGGRVCGTWKRTQRRSGEDFEPSPIEGTKQPRADAIAKAYARLP